MENSHKILGAAALSVLTAAATLFPASNAEAIVVVRAPVIVRAPVMVRPPVVFRPVAPIAPRYTPQMPAARPAAVMPAPVASARAVTPPVDMQARFAAALKNQGPAPVAPASVANAAAHLPAAGGHGGGNKLPPVNGATATGGGGSGGNSGGNSGGGNRLPNNGQSGQSPIHSAAAPQYYSSGGSYVPYSNPWFPYYVMPHSSHAASTPQPLSQQDRGQPVSSGVETRHFVCEPKANESGFNYVRRCETRNSAKANFHMQVRLGCQPAGETAQSWLQRCAVQQVRP